jgi:hypothetical protein
MDLGLGCVFAAELMSRVSSGKPMNPVNFNHIEAIFSWALRVWARRLQGWAVVVLIPPPPE